MMTKISKTMIKTQLPQAVLQDPTINLNKEGLRALFTARAGLKHVGRRELSYELQYSPHKHVKAKRTYSDTPYSFWWKNNLDEPFTGDDRLQLKEDLTKVICDDISLMSIILGDVKEWALSKAGRGGHAYYNMSEFREVYDFRYSVSSRLVNTALLLEVSYV
jgi:hypothetical protein